MRTFLRASKLLQFTFRFSVRGNEKKGTKEQRKAVSSGFPLECSKVQVCSCKVLHWAQHKKLFFSSFTCITEEVAHHPYCSAQRHRPQRGTDCLQVASSSRENGTCTMAASTSDLFCEWRWVRCVGTSLKPLLHQWDGAKREVENNYVILIHYYKLAFWNSKRRHFWVSPCLDNFLSFFAGYEFYALPCKNPPKRNRHIPGNLT